MQRRESDHAGRRRNPTDPRVWPADSSADERRDSHSVGRRRFDGLAIEQLWDRVEALTKETQEQRAAFGALPAILAMIEEGLHLLGDSPTIRAATDDERERARGVPHV